jgi:ankyrin repeat protein
MGNTLPILESAKNANYNEFIMLHTKDAHQLHLVDEFQRNALHWVCYAVDNNTCLTYPGRRVMLADYMINSGIELQSKDVDGNTPLHLACKRNRVDLVRLLIANYVDVNMVNKDGQTPLHLVCKLQYEDYQTREELVKILVKKGANLMSKDKFGRTPIAWAKFRNYSNMYSYLKTVRTEKKTRMLKSKSENQKVGSTEMVIQNKDTSISINISGNPETLDKVMAALSKF